MSYKYSKGAQVIGDLKAADDTQRDTQIDFGEDYIALETSGSVVMVVSGSKVGIGTSSPAKELDVEGDVNISGTTYLDGLAEHEKFSILMVTGSNNMVTSSNSLKYNDSTDGLGIGMGQGGASTAGNPPVFQSGETKPQYKLHVVGDVNDGAAFCTETYAATTGGSMFRFIKGRGTPSSPAAINASDEIGRLDFYSHVGNDTMQLSALIAVTADADGDGKMSFRCTHGGYDNEAFYLYDNRVYFTDQVRIGNVIAPTVNAGTNIGGASARFDEIYGNKLIGYEAVQLKVSSDPSGIANTTHVYCKDVDGSGEVFVRDEAGNVTQISPHNQEGDWVYYSENVKTGKKVKVNMEKMIRRLEEITGETFFEEYIDPYSQKSYPDKS